MYETMKEKNKILFSILSFQESKYKYTGGGNYGIELIKLLQKNNIEIELLYDSNKEIELDIKKNIKFDKLKKIDINNFTSKSLKEYIENNYYLFFSPVREKFRKLKLNIKYIYPVHDLRELELNINLSSLKYALGIKNKIKRLIRILISPFYKKYLKKIILPNKNDVILTVSEYSKYSLKLFYNDLKLENIIVLPPLIKNQKFPLKEEKKILSKYRLKEKEYYLLLSANRWEKNPEIFLKSYDNLIKSHLLNKKVLVIGLKKNIFKLKNIQNFIFVDKVTNEELEVIYKNSYIFVYPTLNEGFGLPPIEAMKYGVPVLASSVTSVMEVCGEAAEYINPHSKIDIQNKILKLTYDSKLYENYCNRAKERYKLYIREQDKVEEEYLNVFTKKEIQP